MRDDVGRARLPAPPGHAPERFGRHADHAGDQLPEDVQGLLVGKVVVARAGQHVEELPPQVAHRSVGGVGHGVGTLDRIDLSLVGCGDEAGVVGTH